MTEELNVTPIIQDTPVDLGQRLCVVESDVTGDELEDNTIEDVTEKGVAHCIPHSLLEDVLLIFSMLLIMLLIFLLVAYYLYTHGMLY